MKSIAAREMKRVADLAFIAVQRKYLGCGWLELASCNRLPADTHAE
jgi:uncharacterized protein YunC (DUF1805 family)